jgi:murein L,D-transpeptidase YcbB/YkuD
MLGQQTFSILLAVLALLVFTGIGGSNFASGDAVCLTNDCHEPETKSHKPERKSHKPHKRILKHGSRGEDVKKLQKILNARGLCPQPIVIDGIFGPTTLTAVRKFQRQSQIPVDGIVGGKTWDRLFASL